MLDKESRVLRVQTSV